MPEKNNSVHLFRYRLFSRFTNTVHVVTTRNGGVSNGPYRSLNLGFLAGDDPDAVLQNRSRLCSAIGAPPASLTTAEQAHETRIAVVRETDRGSGAFDPSTRLPCTDAMITNVSNIPLMVLIADCAAVGLYDPRRKAAGIVHAGWRGTASKIVQKTIVKMSEVFGSDSADIVAAISPSIGPCCYEVGEDVTDSFREAFPEAGSNFFTNETGGKAHLNLWKANEWQLVEQGVKNANIEIAESCTACNTDMYYSHRAEKGKTGRFGGLIMLR